jgi:predicted DNA-binding transcriptional regulator AlpA
MNVLFRDFFCPQNPVIVQRNIKKQHLNNGGYIMTEEYRVLPTSEAAKILGKDRRTLENWRSKGHGPAYIKLNQRAVGYLYNDLIDYIRAHRVEPASR